MNFASPAPGPSRTSQVVALTRAGLVRPHTASGDPGAQQALCAGLTFAPPEWLRPGIEARTRFIDDRVLAALTRGVRQIVICGAGLDDRALRFRTEGARFYELDHPVTQADKAVRLRAIGAGDAGPVLVPCDFEADSVADCLREAGYLQAEPAFFICEGLLVYLDRDACVRLLAGTASVAGPGSVLTATLATYDSDVPAAEVVAVANARRRAAATEPWRTILPRAEHLAMVADAGWRVTETEDQTTMASDVSHRRSSLLVTAVLP